jgi:hypothetical protein
MNVGAAADWTFMRMNYVEHFHKRAKPEQSMSAGWGAKKE